MTLIPFGAYSVHWPEIHLDPEQAVTAHLDVNKGETTSVMLPIHWATFNLALHAWSEPVDRIWTEAKEHDVRLAVPRPDPGAIRGGHPDAHDGPPRASAPRRGREADHGPAAGAAHRDHRRRGDS